MHGLKINPFAVGKGKAKTNRSADMPMHVSLDSLRMVREKQPILILVQL